MKKDKAKSKKGKGGGKKTSKKETATKKKGHLNLEMASIPSSSTPTHRSGLIPVSQYPSHLMVGQVHVVPHVPITVMQRWNLHQLGKNLWSLFVTCLKNSLILHSYTQRMLLKLTTEAHVQKLRDFNQAVPQAVALLHADACRKEEKRQAKRVANRRSASTSRARKKLLIEELTRDNARLRRQALILSYLPDPVVAISPKGTIVFCSMQVEKVLKHSVKDLVGANIEDIMVPSPKESMRRLILDLVIAEQSALTSSEEGGNNQAKNGSSDSGDQIVAHEVSKNSSDQYFPLKDVNVKAVQTSDEVTTGEDISDSSNDSSGKSKSTISSPTPKDSSLGPQSSTDDQPPTKKAKIDATDKKKTSIGERMSRIVS